MDFEEALNLVNNLVFAQNGKRLNSKELLAFQAAWYDKTYQQIYKEVEENPPCKLVDLHHHVAPNLWERLSQVFGNGERVTKKRLRSILERRVIEFSSRSYSGITAPNDEKLFKGLAASCVIGGQPPDVSRFYGRESELKQLREYIEKYRCIVVTGMDGIGKSTLIAKLIDRLHKSPQPVFDYFIWKPIYYAPLLLELITDLLKQLQPELSESELNTCSCQTRVSLLIDYLRSHRCLLVLDSAEALLQGERVTGANPYGPQYAEYELFFRRLAEEQHQSCIILTSRKSFIDIAMLQSLKRSAQTIRIEGLTTEDAIKLMRANGLRGERNWLELVQACGGIPYVINLVSNRILNLFGGKIEDSISYKTSLASDYFQEAFNQQLGGTDHLGSIMRNVVAYLAAKTTEINPIALTKLLNELKKQGIHISLIELTRALDLLQASSLIESSRDESTGEANYAIHPLVVKYILKGQLGMMLTSFPAPRSA